MNPLIEGAMLTRFLPAPRLSPSYCAHMTLQRWTKKFRRVPQFFFFLVSVQTKLSLQSSEFLLTKDRGIANDVHQGPLSVDFDDE